MDIGYHYVAVDANGNPFDNQYGIPDYLGNPYANDTSGDGFSDAWEASLGLNPQISNLNNTSERSTYTYNLADWLRGVSGIRIGSVNLDNEGNVRCFTIIRKGTTNENTEIFHSSVYWQQRTYVRLKLPSPGWFRSDPITCHSRLR